MDRKMNRAGVIGAGVMGATIAAQLANVGIETVLLDIVPPELTDDDQKKGLTPESKGFRNKFGNNGLNIALKSKPASFYIQKNAKLITIGNL
jgi:3-hydroxyacyl-CoA dehydrogenase